MKEKEEDNPRLRLEQYIAMRVKSKRTEQGLKIIDVARIAGLSQGMVSKIENAQVSTSLEEQQTGGLRQKDVMPLGADATRKPEKQQRSF